MINKISPLAIVAYTSLLWSMQDAMLWSMEGSFAARAESFSALYTEPRSPNRGGVVESDAHKVARRQNELFADLSARKFKSVDARLQQMPQLLHATDTEGKLVLEKFIEVYRQKRSSYAHSYFKKWLKQLNPKGELLSRIKAALGEAPLPGETDLKKYWNAQLWQLMHEFEGIVPPTAASRSNVQTNGVQQVDKRESADARLTRSATKRIAAAALSAGQHKTQEESANGGEEETRKKKKRVSEERIQAERLAQEAADKRTRIERESQAQAEQKALEEREAKERKALEQREIQELAERKAKEEAEQKAREEMERAAVLEAEHKAREAIRLAEAAQWAQEALEQMAREELVQRAREEAERTAKEEAEQKAQEETAQRAREEAAAQARAEAEVASKAREEAERTAKAQQELADKQRQAKKEAARKRREEAQKEVQEAARKVREAQDALERKRAEIVRQQEEKAKLAGSTGTNGFKTPNRGELKNLANATPASLNRRLSMSGAGLRTPAKLLEEAQRAAQEAERAEREAEEAERALSLMTPKKPRKSIDGGI